MPGALVGALCGCNTEGCYVYRIRNINVIPSLYVNFLFSRSFLFHFKTLKSYNCKEIKKILKV